MENLLREFRPIAQSWLNAANLPIDELILYLSQELFTDIADLAVAHKIAALHARIRQPPSRMAAGGFLARGGGFLQPRPEIHRIQ